jgi:serine phosphatase RsbU (regulator of sigma subunit)
LSFVIENARLVERIVAEETLRRELALAAEVQQRLFPSDPPVSGSVEMAGYCQPARGVGGDYYDFLQLGDQQIGIALADVAGKGIAAALVMSNVQASLRSQTIAQHGSERPEVSLTELVSTMNRLLCRSTDPSTYVTFFYSQFDERTRQLVFVNAGHNPPLLLRLSDTGARAVPENSVVGREQNVGNMATPPNARADVSLPVGSGNGKVASEFTRLTTGGSVIGSSSTAATNKR